MKKTVQLIALLLLSWTSQPAGSRLHCVRLLFRAWRAHPTD
jgi:hypothetical protein